MKYVVVVASPTKTRADRSRTARYKNATISAGRLSYGDIFFTLVGVFIVGTSNHTRAFLLYKTIRRLPVYAALYDYSRNLC